MQQQQQLELRRTENGITTMPQQVPLPGNDTQQQEHLSSSMEPASSSSSNFHQLSQSAAAHATTNSLVTSNNEANHKTSDKSALQRQIHTNGLGATPTSTQTVANTNSNGAQTKTITTTTIASANNHTNNNNGNSHKLAGKQNGLKNRIIQRPPPLILDKVSNFYDNATSLKQQTSPNHVAQQPATSIAMTNTLKQPQNQPDTTCQQTPTTTTLRNNHQHSLTTNSTTTTQNELIHDHNNPNSNTANSKFWASLNQNATQRKNQPSSSQLSSGTDIKPHHFTTTTTTTTTTKDSTTTSNNNLGPDLIITHRNTNATSSKPSIQTATNRISTSTALMLQQKHQLQQIQPALTPKSDKESLLEETLSNNNQHLSDFSEISCAEQTKPTTQHHHQLHDMSNNSEHDDSSAQGVASESGAGGGNLIGVDNSPPPPPPDTETASRVHFHSPSSSPPSLLTRPKSNNPFLIADEESTSSPTRTVADANTHHVQESITANSHATTNGLNHQQLQPIYSSKDILSLAHQQQQQFNNIQDRLSSLDLNASGNNQQHHQQIYQVHQPYLPVQFLPDQCSHENRYSVTRPPTIDNYSGQQKVVDQSDGLANHHLQALPVVPNTATPTYGVVQNNHTTNQKYVNYEPTMSINSESTIREPPPSATLQLPHWTDAIYTLNNAILDSSSVAGGAENGEFIFVVENGDIILELDQTKVSGYTLVEFRELLESKPMHLLSAVQTKHSHGLTVDLKQYLMCSFPKYSHDKIQQDLIRENIYRRTIPCTTRPPREGEVDKVDYHFLTKEHFIEMNNRGMLLECGMYGGHYYGTMKPYSDRDSLTIYGTVGRREMSEDMQQPLHANHPAIGLNLKKEIPVPQVLAASIHTHPSENPVYENHESLQMHQSFNSSDHNMNVQSWLTTKDLNQNGLQSDQMSNHYGQLKPIPYLPNPRSSVAPVNPEALPPGWEKVYDRVHGTYYIDHHTQSSQYERPYEIELTKGTIGFGFTLVEADNGVLLVRSIIPGGPAHASGIIKPGDILLSAVGVPVANLQHTDIARLFSTFAVGDRVRMTFARSTYIVDTNFVADEYVISNGTHRDMAVAYNVDPMQQFKQNPMMHNSHLPGIDMMDFDIISVSLRRGESGFGFTIVDPGDGMQRVKEIQNAETGMKLMEGDILVELDRQDITRLSHKEVVDRLKQFPIGQEVIITVKRKRNNHMLKLPERPQPRLVEYGTLGPHPDYQSMPVYTNTVMLKNDPNMLPLPVKPMNQYPTEYIPNNDLQGNFYANNKEIAMQRVQYNLTNDPVQYSSNYQQLNNSFPPQLFDPEFREDEYEYHEVFLDRDSRDSNWGIRLIGGAEVDRAISIGSIVFGGAASKNGKLKSGDEIISINGYNVVGATHQHVVDLISTCANQACLVVRRKRFAEACEVLLTRNMDEGFGFVIISSQNCALIGSIIEGSPADRCKQLHVKDQIVAVNGNYITPDMQHPDIVNLIKECGSTLRLRIIPADCYTVELIKNSLQDNFGFSIRGGSEYDGTPLYILRVAPKGLARDLLNVGDQIIEINNLSTVGMTHQQAATIIKYSDPIVKLKLRRNHVIPPSLLVASPKELATYNQVTAEMKTVSQMTTPNHLHDG